MQIFIDILDAHVITERTTWYGIGGVSCQYNVLLYLPPHGKLRPPKLGASFWGVRLDVEG